MTSTDTLGIAPNAKLFDIRIFEKERIEESFLDVVIEAYDWAIQQLRRNGTPQILSNSWGGQAQFQRSLITQTGILVLFSAGNCGDPCGSRNPNYCRTNGPGKSINGINGHPLVMTVSAANINDVRAGYSAQGPANFDEH